MWAILLGMIVLSATLPVFLLVLYTRKKRAKTYLWRTLLVVVLFDVSFVPYAIFVMLTGSMENLIYFFLIWGIYYFTRPLCPAVVSLVITILCGVMLAIPASTFVSFSKARLVFSNPLPSLMTGSVAMHGWSEVTALLAYKVAWGVAPILAAHYLVISMDSEPVQ